MPELVRYLLSLHHFDKVYQIGEQDNCQSLLTKFVTCNSIGYKKIILEYKNNSSEDSVEKEVVVAVNGEESRVVFIDHQHGAMKLENLVMTYEPHAFLVVLAVDDISSLGIVSTCHTDASCDTDALLINSSDEFQGGEADGWPGLRLQPGRQGDHPCRQQE